MHPTHPTLSYVPEPIGVIIGVTPLDAACLPGTRLLSAAVVIIIIVILILIVFVDDVVHVAPRAAQIAVGIAAEAVGLADRRIQGCHPAFPGGAFVSGLRDGAVAAILGAQLRPFALQHLRGTNDLYLAIPDLVLGPVLEAPRPERIVVPVATVIRASVFRAQVFSQALYPVHV